MEKPKIEKEMNENKNQVKEEGAQKNNEGKKVGRDKLSELFSRI